MIHLFVATISASQELRAVQVCLMDFQLIAPPPCPAYNISGDAVIFEEVKGSAIGNHVPRLYSPACVRETCETGNITWSGGSGICVGFFVMMCWKMVESLDGVADVRVVANAIICCAVKVFEGIESRFVMFM